ncbi:hypothetical protein F3Y22_tig00116937pilonHSYRG00047 [Hibiscus syriacus]|uniref:Cyclin-D6-1 n=1 Tax=Hibiscus syriacus TaxID=106335 RepID=A0A6A2WZH9_HIBSY|nr:putative cyclin-D6-1 [Hibiscus syriacus]KAE8661190.1 hypothetical protein F3Y22_tig00116937pilonHSYRG00047 [Hibiscus syriacus]
MEFNIRNPLTLFTHSCPSIFLAEYDDLPTLKATDADICFRREAICSISQFACKFDPFISYLAVNYLDRFLSTQAIPQQPKPWVLRLVAVCCVSLAAKMNEADFSLTDVQADGGFMFDAQTVERMEYVILGALKWRMRSITPFSFVSFFISFFNRKDPSLTQALNARAVEIIFKAQSDIKVLEFKPSIIAASALLSASNELFPLLFPSYHKAISSCLYIHKENPLECYNWMVGKERDDSMVYSCNTAVNVLDHQFSCSESENGKISDYSENQTPISLRSNTVDDES